jgi:membrane protein DedA with SNARE-associated domain
MEIIEYLTIFFGMMFQNSIFPFAMEIVLVPAGFLAYKGDLNLFFIILSGTLGQLAGSLLNYFIAYYFGEKLIIKFINKDKLEKSKLFFNKNSIVGFFMPGIRAYLSLPAGIFRYNIIKFSLVVFLASFLWVSLVSFMGYFIGEDEKLIKQYISYITIFVILIGIGIGIKIIKEKK